MHSNNTLHRIARWLSFALCLSLLSSPVHAESENLVPQNNAPVLLDDAFVKPQVLPVHKPYTAEEAEQLNKLYSIWKTELDSLVANIQHLSQLLYTNKLTPADRYEAGHWLYQLNMLIGKTMQLPYAPLNAHKLVRFFTFNKILIKALSQAIHNNFEDLVSIEELNGALHELDAALRLSTKSNISIATAANFAQETELAAETLANKVGRSGLTWYNHAYRKLLSMDRQFHLSSMAKTALVVGTGVSIYLMLFGRDKDGVEKFAGNPILGPWRQAVRDNTEPYVNYWDYSKPEYHRAAMAMGLGNLVVGAYNMGVFSKIGQVAADFDAFLKGSSSEMHKNSVQYIDDITLEDEMFDCVRHLLKPFYDIRKFMKDSDLYIRSGMKVPKCILLTGAPGNGKSHCIRGFLGSLNKDLAEMGRFEKVGYIEVEPWDNVEERIQQAIANAPCVLVMDEFHLLNGGPQINSGAIFLSKLLTELDKIELSNDPLRQIFVAAATNRPDLLSRSLLRHGRFGPDARIDFPMPDFIQRLQVFEALCRHSAVDTSSIDLAYFARLTQGVSFSAISKVFEKAGFLAKEQAIGIATDHLYEALNRTLRVLNARVGLNEQEKEIIAVHMAGVALAHLLLDTPLQLDAVTIQMPARTINETLEFVAKIENQDEDKQHISRYGAFYTYNENEHITQESSDRFVTSKLLLSGIMTQQAVLGKKSSYGKDDRQLAYQNALGILLDGYKLDELDKETQNTYKREALKTVEMCEIELKKLFAEHKDEIRRIADELKQKHFLTAPQIKQLLAQAQQEKAGAPA